MKTGRVHLAGQHDYHGYASVESRVADFVKLDRVKFKVNQKELPRLVEFAEGPYAARTIIRHYPAVNKVTFSRLMKKATRWNVIL